MTLEPCCWGLSLARVWTRWFGWSFDCSEVVLLFVCVIDASDGLHPRCYATLVDLKKFTLKGTCLHASLSRFKVHGLGTRETEGFHF